MRISDVVTVLTCDAKPTWRRCDALHRLALRAILGLLVVSAALNGGDGWGQDAGRVAEAFQIPETDDGRFLCFRQTKYAVGGESFAAIGGFIEPGESPEVAARRELLEETGFEASHWAALGEFAVADDSGLEVEALDGRPGVRSARYGGPGLDDAGRVARLLAEVEGRPGASRRARFVCWAAFAEPSGATASAMVARPPKMRRIGSGEAIAAAKPATEPTK